MTKKEIFKKTAEIVALPPDEVKAVLDAHYELIGDTLAKGDKVSIHGFGTFHKTHRKARTGYNFITNEIMDVSDYYGVKFEIGNLLREKLNK